MGKRHGGLAGWRDGEQGSVLTQECPPARQDDLFELAVGSTILGQRHIAVAAQRPVRLEKVRLAVVGRKDATLLDQDLLI
jgi:hypothetical protein